MANNGNWRTAERWARLLSAHYRVIVQGPDAVAPTPATGDAVAMIALHARRGRAAIVDWKRRSRSRPLVVALTGTDLYRDLPAGNSDVRASLADADRLIVLQGDARGFVPPEARHKVDVILQSAFALTAWRRKASHRLQCVLVAHLRPEKDPGTVMAAWRSLPPDLPIFLSVIGEALDPELGNAFRELAARDPRVRWLGALSHARTRQAIRRAHILLCPSLMEGGANVIVEAITAGTAVIASDISGNLGMLGPDYGGYFPAGNAGTLAQLLVRAWSDRALLATLESQCQVRAGLFTPEAERSALVACVTRAIEAAATRGLPDRATNTCA